MLLGVDVGGTFTDAVLLDEDGGVYSAKAPSTPGEEARGVLAAIDTVLARAGADPSAVRRFAHGMTVATNALLEGRGARTALLATEGFTDVVELGRQARADLYRLCAAHPPPLVPAALRFGVAERCGPDGIITELRGAEQLVERVAQAAPQAVAVVLLHAYAHSAHERELGRLLAQRLPGVWVSLSHEVVGTFRETERAATTEIDAALSPLLAGYLEQLSARAVAQGLPAPRVMQSSGGLCEAARAGGARAILSGPAGGAAGAALLARSANEPRVLCLDMGGTACDVCLLQDGEVAETSERTVAGRTIALNMLDIHTVGAGGGSIAWRDAGGALRVGPRSAGADPGPACYGRGGAEATVSDANLLLGRLPLLLAEGFPLDVEAARAAIARLAEQLDLEVLECALGIVRVADSEMVQALRVISIERGVDPRGYALMCFGGCGPLHAAAVAHQLGIETVLCPAAGGVLSALGLAAAAPRSDAARSMPGADAAQLQRRVRAELGEPPVRERLLHEMRYEGQSFELAVEDPADFEHAYRQRYGYDEPDTATELVTLRATAWGAAPQVTLSGGGGRRPAAARRSRRQIVFAAGSLEGELIEGTLEPGTAFAGPAVCALPQTTLLVPADWRAAVQPDATIRLTR
ncbi:MAG: hydantoinase/oxoprolinase family protein [Solirubrobacteraceae bacterium]